MEKIKVVAEVKNYIECEIEINDNFANNLAEGNIDELGALNSLCGHKVDKIVEDRGLQGYTKIVAWEFVD